MKNKIVKSKITRGLGFFTIGTLEVQLASLCRTVVTFLLLGPKVACSIPALGKYRTRHECEATKLKIIIDTSSVLKISLTFLKKKIEPYFFS